MDAEFSVSWQVNLISLIHKDSGPPFLSLSQRHRPSEDSSEEVSVALWA